MPYIPRQYEIEKLNFCIFTQNTIVYPPLDVVREIKIYNAAAQWRGFKTKNIFM